MLRTALTAALIAAAPFAVYAETLYVGFYSPPQTDDEVIKLLGEPGENVQVDPLVHIEGGASTYKIITDRDTGRSKGFARMGVVGHAVPEPDACQLDTANRDDAAAVAVQAQLDAVAHVQDLVEQIETLGKEIKVETASTAGNYKLWQEAVVAVKSAEAHHTAAHEAAHVVQQRTAAAALLAQQKKGQPYIIAALELQVEYQKALAVDVAAESALADAKAAEAKAHEAAIASASTLAMKMEDMKRVRAQSTLTTARAKELSAAAGDLINAAIVSEAEAVLSDSLALADFFDEATDVAYAVGSFASKLGNVAKGTQARALGNVMQSAGSLARAESEFNLLKVEQAKRLPAIPSLDDEAELDKLPQMQSLAEVMIAVAISGGLSLTVAMGVSGESPVDNGLAQLADVVRSSCVGPDCAAEAGVLLGQIEDMQYLALQNAMQNENRLYTAVSNVLKTKHDTAKNSVGNIR